MKLGIVLAFIFVLVILVSGCTEQKPVCKIPYILNGTTCCLDNNYNLICDADETPKEPICGDGICSSGETCAQDNCCSGQFVNLQTDSSNCGSCENVCGSGKVCSDGTCQSSTTPCTPNTCSSLDYECGTSADGCGGTLNCGPNSISCAAKFGTCSVTGTKTCSNGKYGSCVATDPRIKNCAGKECGSDGCGGSCGFCASDYKCVSGNCCKDACQTDSDCDDNDISTKDICSGTPKKCSNIPITSCINNDGYCPSGCTHGNDNDCDKTILDCYNDDLTEIICDANEALEFTNIFEEGLESCKPLEGTFALGFEPLLAIFRGYKIQGIEDGNCTVTFWFLENSKISPELLNKQMTCKYNVSERTLQHVNDCIADCCSGPLKDAIV